jgi:hypothetical protein
MSEHRKIFQVANVLATSPDEPETIVARALTDRDEN